MFEIFFLIIVIFLSQKQKILKFFSFFCIFFLLIIGSSSIQNNFISFFFPYKNKTILKDINYSVIIMGGNYHHRVNLLCDILHDANIVNILIIKDDFEKLFFHSDELNNKCLDGIEIMTNKESTKSTIEDIEIIYDNLDYLLNDIIIITDNFHIKRVDYFLKKKIKDRINIKYYTYNYFDFIDTENQYSIKRGILMLKTFFKENLIIILDKFYVI